MWVNSVSRYILNDQDHDNKLIGEHRLFELFCQEGHHTLKVLGLTQFTVFLAQLEAVVLI